MSLPDPTAIRAHFRQFLDDLPIEFDDDLLVQWVEQTTTQALKEQREADAQICADLATAQTRRLNRTAYAVLMTARDQILQGEFAAFHSPSGSPTGHAA